MSKKTTSSVQEQILHNLTKTHINIFKFLWQRGNYNLLPFFHCCRLSLIMGSLCIRNQDIQQYFIFCHGHAEKAMHCRHAKINFTRSITLNHQELNHNSLLFLGYHHFQCELTHFSL